MENDYLVLSKKIDKLQRENEINKKILKSHHNLFENIFINYDLKSKGVLKLIQDLEVELLTFIDNICNKHDLDYWLDYGTLLGAKRHEGFVPWDDDIDLGMMRSDFNELFPILKEEVSKKGLDNLHVNIYHQNNKNILISYIQCIYRHPIYKNAMATLDIFPNDYRKSSEIVSKKECLYYRDKFHMDLLKGIPSEKVIEEYFNDFDLTYDETEFIFPGVEVYPIWGSRKELKNVETKNIFPLKRIKFYDRYFNAPNNADILLKNNYGDYMHFPQIIRDHGLLNRVNLNEGTERHLTIAIEELSKANKSYSL